jgi:hypothetical protein
LTYLVYTMDYNNHQNQMIKQQQQMK